MGIIFCLFAYWQFNDPDNWVWIVEYGVVAVLTFMAAFKRYTWISGLVVVGSLIWFFVLAHALGPNWIEIEEAREALGLLISAVWALFLFILWWKAHRKSTKA